MDSIVIICPSIFCLCGFLKGEMGAIHQAHTSGGWSISADKMEQLQTRSFRGIWHCEETGCGETGIQECPSNSTPKLFGTSSDSSSTLRRRRRRPRLLLPCCCWRSVCTTTPTTHAPHVHPFFPCYQNRLLWWPWVVETSHPWSATTVLWEPPSNKGRPNCSSSSSQENGNLPTSDRG